MTRPRARLIAFFALVSFGALQWIRLLDPAPVGRTIWFLLAAIVAGIALRWCNRLERRRRWGATAGIAFVLVLVGLLLAGVPFSLVEPRGWGDLVSGLNQGVGTLPSMRIPYRGAEPWAHDTLVFIGYLLVALATVLACLPRGDARPGRPLAAAVVVGVLVGVPSVSLESSSPVLIGLVFTALLVAYLRIDRVRRDAMVWAGATVAGVLLVALVLAPRVDADRPLIDYEAIAASVSKTDGASFNWSHSYGPLNWPRTGRELLRIKTDRAAYWKATNLVEFDGVRWTTGGDRGCRASTPPRCPTSATRGASASSSRSAACARRRSSGRGRRCRWPNSPRPVRESGRGASRRRGPAHVRAQAYTARGVRAGADPPRPGARGDDLSALQPGLPQHGAAGHRSAARVDRRDRELLRARATRRGSASRRGTPGGARAGPAAVPAATRATATAPWRPRGTRARGISASG